MRLNLIVHDDVNREEIWKAYPPEAKNKLLKLRDLILESAAEIDGLDKIEETLKWGEVSYLTKHGSTLRIDWKENKPDSYGMYFNCNTSLVESFRLVYGDLFNYEKNRALVFDLKDKIPESSLRECIRRALTYHKVKQLPLLGL